MPRLTLFWVVLGGFAWVSPSLAQPPLHEEIDRIIEAAAGGPVAPAADDAEFLRRVYLDLAGRIPSAGETRAFLADAAPEKRAGLVDRLLASEDHVHRLSQVLHVREVVALLLVTAASAGVTLTARQDRVPAQPLE